MIVMTYIYIRPLIPCRHVCIIFLFLPPKSTRCIRCPSREPCFPSSLGFISFCHLIHEAPFVDECTCSHKLRFGGISLMLLVSSRTQNDHVTQNDQHYICSTLIHRKLRKCGCGYVIVFLLGLVLVLKYTYFS